MNNRVQFEDIARQHELLRNGAAYPLEQDWDGMKASPALKEVSPMSQLDLF